jgi:hypothetical protein
MYHRWLKLWRDVQVLRVLVQLQSVAQWVLMAETISSHSSFAFQACLGFAFSFY